MPIPENAKKVFIGQTFDVHQWEQILSDGSTEVIEVIKWPNKVEIIVLFEDNSIWIIRQEQSGQSPIYSLIDGTIEPWEESFEAAERVLLEKAGLIIDNDLYGLWEYDDDLDYIPTPAISTKIDCSTDTYIVRNCKKVSEINSDDWAKMELLLRNCQKVSKSDPLISEKIELFRVSLDEFMIIMTYEKFHNKELAFVLLRLYVAWQKEAVKKYLHI